MGNNIDASRVLTILVPVDFSACGEAALAQGLVLARQSGARLVLLNVAELLPGTLPPGSTDFPSLERQLVASSESRLRELLSGVDVSGVRIDLKVRAGWPFTVRKPWQEILTAAAEEGAGMIVIGTHGRTGFDHMILGSTAERVIRQAPCPVVTVRSRPTA